MASPNTLAGINDDIIASGVIRGFTKKIAPLFAFSTDFSSEAVRPGEKISVLRDNDADTVTVEVQKVSHGAYAIGAADADAVEISLGQPFYVSWSLDDTEIAQSSVLSMEVFGERKGNRLAQYVLEGTGTANGIWNSITAANFLDVADVNKIVGADTAFTSDDIAKLAKMADELDWPDEGRSVILNPVAYSEVVKDVDDFQVPNSPGVTAFVEGKVPMLYGFQILKSNIIPANAENLYGFAAHPSALATAFRYLSPQEGNTYFRAERVQGPGGIVLGLRDWYDNDTGVRKRVVETVFGTVAGLPTGMIRLVSA